MSTIQGCRHQLEVTDNENNCDITSACEYICITYFYHIYEFKQRFVLLSLPFIQTDNAKTQEHNNYHHNNHDINHHHNKKERFSTAPFPHNK